VLGIIIAAGRGLRMRPLTYELPKCMLNVGGRPLLHATMESMRAAGCDEFVIIVGHLADKIDHGGVTCVVNRHFETNNILHSLMAARDYLDGPVMCSYADIWVEPHIHHDLANTQGDIVLAVDTDWEPYYEGRSEHPLSEAENVFFDETGHVRKIGKHLDPAGAGALQCGEFLGLWRLSRAGAALFKDTFLSLDECRQPDSAFQHARGWWQAYITDMVQELVDREHQVRCALIERGWAELDTLQDYERLVSVSARQRLHSLHRAQGVKGAPE
jgi:L-glutamine-phosphate cytidylyltransferase